MAKRSFITSTHPIYDAWKAQWALNEQRLRGGAEVLEELRKFDWEDDITKEAYKSRQADATYVNFPELHTVLITGHLTREAPAPGGGLDFGSLGSLESRSAAAPDPAVQVYDSVDATGTDGSQWDQWWMSTFAMALATGHRWIYCDAPLGAEAQTRADELNGVRPYAVEFSPLAVPQWDIERGVLNMAIVKQQRRRLRREAGGTLSGTKPEDVYLLLVRQGWDGFDYGEDLFSAGGWWLLNKEGDLIVEDGQPLQGSWDATGGSIPMTILYAQRDRGTVKVPALSRPSLTGLGQVAVSYMNLSSAADYDAWDAAQSVIYLLGVDGETHAAVRKQWEAGSKVVGVPLQRDMTGEMTAPTIQDGSTGTVAAAVFDARLKNKWEEARVLAALEATGSPDTSGVSKQITFRDVMQPRLSNFAANLEDAQTSVLRDLEALFGEANPSATVTWPREFNLKDIVQDINTIFDMELRTGYQNPDFGASLMARAAAELALVTEEEREALLEQYREIALAAAEQKARSSAALFGNIGGGTAPPAADAEEDEETVEAELEDVEA